MRQVRLKSVSDAVFAPINGDRRAEALHEFFKCGAQIYVLAGALRDAIAAHYVGDSNRAPRDFDIAVTHVRREDFDAVLLAFGRRNRHGGYVLRGESGPDWDVWRLEETIGLRKTGAPCSIENVLRTFNLDCNAIALDLRTGLFLDGGAIKAVQQKRVGFVHGAIRHSEDTFAAKALLLDLRLKYMLVRDLKQFVNANLDCVSLAHEAEKVFPHIADLRISGSPKAFSSSEPMSSSGFYIRTPRALMP
jgi:hypothetical protein